MKGEGDGYLRMDRGLLATLATSAAIAIFLIYFGYARYEAFNMSACGIGIYLQSLYNSCLGRPFYNTINGNLLYWRFEPIIALLAPFFCLFKSPLVLIVSQALAVSATLPLVYVLASSLVQRPFLFTIIFSLNPIFIGLGLYDFSTVALSMPLLFLTLIALEKKRMKSFIVSSTLFLMTSSIAGLILLSIGFFLSTRFEGERRLWGNLLMLIGSVGLLTTILIMQKLNPEWLWYRASHASPLFERRLIVTGVILANFLFAPLFTAEGAVSLIPLVTVSLLYESAPFFRIGTYMPAPLYLLASVISLYTLSALRNEDLLKYSLPLSLIFFAAFNPLYPVLGRFDFVAYYSLPTFNDHYLFLKELINKLPDVPMTVQSNIFTHLFNRDDVYVDYRRGIKLAVMDSSSAWYPYIASALLLKENFKNSCELFDAHISQLVKLLSDPSPFAGEFEREFKVAFAFDNVVVASRGLRINVSVPKSIVGLFYKDTSFRRKALTMLISKISLNWNAWSPYPTIPADGFSAIIKGKVKLGGGTYVFYLQSDGGGWMRLGNVTLFNCLSANSCLDVDVVRLKGGVYPFVVKYVEHGGTSSITVYYKKEGWRGFAYLNSTVER